MSNDAETVARLRAENAALQAEIANYRWRLGELEQRSAGGDAPETYAVELNRAGIEWHLSEGRLAFFGLPAALFWLKPSLLSMLQPLAEEVGIPLFRTLVAYHASLGTEDDYHAMVTVLGTTFEEGFLAWGRAVGAAGWGRFSLTSFDLAGHRAVVVVHNPWELLMQRDQPTTWGCPFLQGKLIGIFSHALGINCWADEYVVADSSELAVELHIYPSDLTTELALRNAREQQAGEVEQEQQIRVQQQLIETQQTMIRELSTPLLPLADHVLALPLVGTVDSTRAQQFMEGLLDGIARYQATVAIVDITGVKVVDMQVAQALVQAARAVQLLGAQVVLTGIQPHIAQTLVQLGSDLGGIVTRPTLQAGIAYALTQRGRG